MPVQLLNESVRPSTLNHQLSTKLELRPFPYPFRAMLAICSDLDETPDAQVYEEQMRFLNTHETTSMGEGVDLEVGNTIYFDMLPGQFAYWNTDDAGREMARALMRSGHIDCLHSYGDLAVSRAHAMRALEELERHQLSLKVWIDHARAPTNFGADIMQGHGDEPDHPAYHADLTLRHGVRYVWRGRVTSVIGQDRPVSLIRLPSALCPRTTLAAQAKEAAKQVFGWAGHRKYAFHATNRVCSLTRLRDDRRVFEFLRCNPHPRGLDNGDTGFGIAEVLTPRFLDRLVEREGFCLLYTHLGKLDGDRKGFNRAAIESFRLLARYQQEGKVLVTTTRRLLDFSQTARRVTYSASTQGEKAVIEIALHADGSSPEVMLSRDQMDGLTFYISDS
ncbi:MAG TPA: hypothetical protein VK633_10815, partial [Verrucomicrobiae bacterium]|nr:hypothetical protein [Verrucomicrobiae bacterium]